MRLICSVKVGKNVILLNLRKKEQLIEFGCSDCRQNRIYLYEIEQVVRS